MASVLKDKNARDRTPLDRQLGHRFQWTPHCGARQRTRYLRRLRAEALREQRDGCDWLQTTSTLRPRASEGQEAAEAAEARRLAGCE